MLTLTKSLFALMLGFISSTIFGLIAIPFLKKLKAGQNINIYVEAHRSKAGTPTMGGIIFIIPTIAITVFLLLTDILTEKSVPVAVIVQPSDSSSFESELCVSFGIELHQLQSV